MRLIVACQKCRRQYDAAGRSPGSRFRCHCGEVVTVEEPKGHDAEVVRCSACGAPREKGATSCQFCEADFTLHERDLNTVCPKCLARISSRAKFCHYCGIRLLPESVAGDDTSLLCPACDDEHRLTSRRIGEVAVLECDRCAGLWLGNEVFQDLTERASSDTGVVDSFSVSTHARPAHLESPEEQAQEHWRYRDCVVCGKMMHRRNFARRSGVIIDICKDHGIWFDADELPRILAWIRTGGMAKASEQRAAQATREERLERITKPRPEGGATLGEPLGVPGGYYHHDPLGGFLDEIIEWFLGAR
ncbi:MAG: zinc ribbon domain-containing protein [Planctomycetota bacterium]